MCDGLDNRMKKRGETGTQIRKILHHQLFVYCIVHCVMIRTSRVLLRYKLLSKKLCNIFLVSCQNQKIVLEKDMPEYYTQLLLIKSCIMLAWKTNSSLIKFTNHHVPY